MKLVIETKEELEVAIEKFGDSQDDVNYIAVNRETDKMFTIRGCTYLSEAARFIDEDHYLFITDDNELAKKVEESAEKGLEIVMKIIYYKKDKLAVNYTLNQEAHNVKDEYAARVIWGSHLSEVIIK